MNSFYKQKFLIFAFLFIALFLFYGIFSGIEKKAYDHKKDNFDIDFIISDEVFTNINSMSIEQIQKLLESKNSPLADRNLYQYYYLTYPTDMEVYNLVFPNGKLARESSPAEIIYYVCRLQLKHDQRPIRINPQILLILLELKSGLIGGSSYLYQIDLDNALKYEPTSLGEYCIGTQGFINQLLGLSIQLDKDFNYYRNTPENEKSATIIDGKIHFPKNAVTYALQKYLKNSKSLLDFFKITIVNSSAFPSTGNFIFPVGFINNYYNFNVTQGYGPENNGHVGIDYSNGRSGDFIRAIANGKVVYRQDSTGNTGWGHMVRIKHKLPSGEIIYSQYAHMLEESILVSLHQNVFKGQLIGKVGDTGYSTGSHLHLEVKKIDQNGFGYIASDDWSNYYNPIDFIIEKRNICQAIHADPSVRWHPDGTLIRAPNASGDDKHKVYLIHNGKKKHIIDADFLNKYYYDFDWNQVIEVNPEELDCFPTGENENIDMTSRIERVDGADNVYLIFNNKYKRWIKTEEVLKGLGYSWDEVNVVSIIEEEDDPVAPTLSSPYPDGTLIRKYGGTKVYVISNGKKRWIKNSNTFNMLGYNSNCIVDDSSSVIDPIPEITPSIDESIITGVNPELFTSTNPSGPWSYSVSGKQGTTFYFQGTGFSPNSQGIQHIKNPDGSDQDPKYISIDSDGKLSWSYKSDLSTPVGPYVIFVLDIKKAKASNFVYETITEGGPIQHTLTISTTSGGTTSPSPGTYTYNSGTTVQIRAIPSSGYNFSQWSGVPPEQANDNPVTVTIDSDKSLTANFVSGTPSIISLSTSSLNFGATTDGRKTSDQQFKISNAGEGTLHWSLSDDAPWLLCSPSSGSGNARINVSVEPAGLSAGTYPATIIVSSPNASNSPQTITVNLNLMSPSSASLPFGSFDTPVDGTTGVTGSIPLTGWVIDDIEVKNVKIWMEPVESVTPHIWRSPSSMSFVAIEGVSNPLSQTLQIKNAVGGTLNYSITDDVTWLSAFPASGTSIGSTNDHTVSVDISTVLQEADVGISALPPGTYYATITISASSASNSPQTTAVTLTINPADHTITTPNMPSGPSSGETDTSYTYTTGGSSCSQGHSVEYRFDWGDGSYSDWSSSASDSHSWSSAGAYTVKAQARCAENNSIISDWSSGKTVTISVPQSEIWRSPSSMSFVATEGGTNPSSQTLQIKNSGGGTLSYSITDDAGWLSVSPTSGTSTGSTNDHTVSVDITGMSAETYNATITITASGASNSPQTASVTLTINPADHTVTTPNTPSGESSGDVNTSYTYTTGGSSCSQGHSVEYRLDWGDGNYSDWSSSTSASHSWSSAGTYTVKAQARCAVNNDIISPRSSGKTVTISEAVKPPEIYWAPTSMTFVATVGGSNPSSGTLQVENSGGGMLIYSIADDADWLTVSPDSGSSSGPLETNDHTVSVDISGMSPATYNATLTITAPGASNSPQTVPVKLVIFPVPDIWWSPSSMSFTAAEGGSNPSSQELWVRGEDNGTLTYSISSDVSWLSVSPTSGTSIDRGTVVHTVSVDVSGMSEGTYSGTLTITAPGASNSPQTVSVTLNINEVGFRYTGLYDTPNYARGVDVSGNYAYVADGTTGLLIINISNPGNPSLAGTVDTPGDARGVFVSGSYAYVADKQGGLRVINVSSPSSPYEVGSINTPGNYATDIYVSGSYAYVADWFFGLVIIDISNPGDPSEAGRLEIVGATGVDIYDSRAYVASVNEGLKIVNISDPSNPVVIGSFNVSGGQPYDVFISNPYAYISESTADLNGLRIVDISDSTNPYQVGNLQYNGTAKRVVVSGSYAYHACDGAGLRMINISNPSNPSELDVYDTSGYAFDVKKAGSYLYVADGLGGLVILEILGVQASNNIDILSTSSDLGLSYADDTFGFSESNAEPNIDANENPYNWEDEVNNQLRNETQPINLFADENNNEEVQVNEIEGASLNGPNVKTVISREKVAATNGLVYVGDAVFVEGARQDIAQMFSGYPMNNKAGWGYMLLTNSLPNQGNGTYTFHAIAYDAEGNEVDLGIKTITCDNANAVKPFGAIDTPKPGEEVSGSIYRNHGWTLTPLPNHIPIDGSTIYVFIDGISIGHPSYGNYRSDIAAFFKEYINSNTAGGYFDIDIAKYKNGLHTIAWSVRDSAGNAAGIGSRFFSIFNTGTSGASQTSSSDRKIYIEKKFSFESIRKLPLSLEPIRIRKGYSEYTNPEIVKVNSIGVACVEIKELGRIEVDFEGEIKGGYLLVGEELRPLPVGSILYEEKGKFYWQPGLSFVGEFDFVFVREERRGTQSQIRIRVRIKPKFDI